MTAKGFSESTTYIFLDTVLIFHCWSSTFSKNEYMPVRSNCVTYLPVSVTTLSLLPILHSYILAFGADAVRRIFSPLCATSGRILTRTERRLFIVTLFLKEEVFH